MTTVRYEERIKSRYRTRMYDVYVNNKYVYSVSEDELEVDKHGIKIKDENKFLSLDNAYSMIMGRRPSSNSPSYNFSKYATSSYSIDRPNG